MDRTEQQLPADRQILLRAINREVSNLLGRVDGLIQGRGNISAPELRAVRRLLEAASPDIEQAFCDSSVDSLLRSQLEIYAGNLRALETSLRQVRCVMLARRARMDVAQRHADGLRSWVNAYRQTAL